MIISLPTFDPSGASREEEENVEGLESRDFRNSLLLFTLTKVPFRIVWPKSYIEN